MALQGAVISQNDAQLISDRAINISISNDEVELYFLATSIYIGLVSFINKKKTLY